MGDFEVPLMHRFAPLDKAVAKRSADGQDLTFSIAIASEFPVERWYGTEILSMDKGHIRLARLNDGAALLFNHDPDEIRGSHIPGSARVAKDRVLRADIVVTGATQAGRDAQGLIDGGHLTKISTGYQIFRVIEESGGKARTLDGRMFERTVRAMQVRGDTDIVAFRRKIDEVAGRFERADGNVTYRITDWEPYESSLVSTPADPTVGIGRMNDVAIPAVRDAGSPTATTAATQTGVSRMDQNQSGAAGATAEPNPSVQMGVDHSAVERLRIKTLQGLGRQHNIPTDVIEGWVDSGVDINEAAQKCLETIAERSKKNVKDNPANLGMNAQDIKRYSIARAVRACVDKSWAKIAPFEAELSQAVAQRIGKQSTEHTFYVPLEVQWAARAQRDMNVATSTLGGYLVGTNIQSFIDVLRNRSVVMRMGATTLPGLQGVVSIPKLTAAATAYWFASEAGTATESTPTIGQLGLSPKTVGGYVEVSRHLMLQATMAPDQIINNDLGRVIALAVDTAALAGPGTAGQPTGIVNTSGVGTANPSTGTAITYADMIRFQTNVAASNAMMPGFGYVTTPTVAGILMGKPRFTNSDTPIWGGNILDGTVVGAAAMSSQQVGSGSMLAGDFSQVVIGEWGVLEIEANPYAQFQSGIIGIRALYTVDIGVRYGAAFALGTGMTG